MNHHTLLHNPNWVRSTPVNKNEKGNFNQQPRTSGQQHHTRPSSANHLSSKEVEVLLTTIQLKVKSADGNYVILRGLLDQGSQVNLITENVAQLLKLQRKKLHATVSGVGSTTAEDCMQIYSLRLYI